MINNESLLNTLPKSVINSIELIDNAEMLDKETLNLLSERVKEMKPLDPKLSKILSDNLLYLF